MGILNKALKNVNLDDISYGEDDSDTIIFVRLLALHIKFEKLEALKRVKRITNEKLFKTTLHLLQFKISLDESASILFVNSIYTGKHCNCLTHENLI